MRKHGITLGVLTAALLASATASADPIGKDSSVKGNKENAGSNASGGGGGAALGGATPATDGASRSDPEKSQQTTKKEKPWEIALGWEGHRLIRQSDLEGAGADKFFNYYFAEVHYDFSKYDRVQLLGGVYQRFLADPQETGLRADDIVGLYRRYIPLPDKYDFYVSGSVLAPTSFVSYREGLITAPRVALRLDRTFAEYVTVSARASGTYFWQRYNTMRDGTGPNPLARIGAGLDVDVTMPFHKPLSAGIGATTGYSWYHNATSPPPAEPGAGQTGVIPDQQFPRNPITQSYGGEIHVVYKVPEVISGVSADASIAYAQGDPSLGFTSTLHDGISHVYLFYRLDSELYATLTARY